MKAADMHRGLKAGEFSSEELIGQCLRTIGEKEPALHAFLHVDREGALAQAKRAQSGSLLAGMPVAVKDAILVEGMPCTAGSRMLQTYTAPVDAFVIEKLREAGGVIVGKTNMDEFAMGASTENSAFGPTKNPRNLERVPGGSSGGSAAAVASLECPLALGSDTGGSIRQPAAFCGIVGFKPTYGMVSRSGLIALASSLDQIGPMAQTVEDAELLFRAIAGKDPKDATSVDSTYQPHTGGSGLKGLRVGVPKEYVAKGLDQEVKQGVEARLRAMEQAGAEVREVELPHTEYALAAYYVINMSEASANLARYDGIRYGTTTRGKTADLEEFYLRNRGEGLGAEVKRRIMLGTYALSAGYYDAYYLKAQKVRTLLQQDFEKAFQKVDLLAGPVSPVLPFKLGERVHNPLAMYLVDVYTVPVNLAGLPALSLPAGTSREGLPIGMQLIGPAFQDSLLFRVGREVEQLS